MTKQDDIALGQLQTTYKLEFQTWTGSSYTWTDYSDRLMGFGDITFQIESRAIPNAFSSSINSLRLRNDDDFFVAINTLDGALANASEPYGKYLYKRALRISSIDTGTGGTTTTVIFTGRVIDIEFERGGVEVACKVASMDVASKDQKCDGEVAQRHPLGSNDSTDPSPWTASAPAYAGQVAMYRFRHLEADLQTVSMGWFTNKRVYDILIRTAWALDDIGTDIENIIIYTEDSRDICSSRNIPPDNESISDGTGDMRTRVSCWNDNRGCMVFGVGNRIYDYNVITNVYAHRNTLGSQWQIVFMQYIEKADTNGVVDRIVIVALDTSVITTPSTLETGAGLLNAPAYIGVYNASGSGAYYTPPGGPNIESLGADFFPCTHATHYGFWFGDPNFARAIGHIDNPDVIGIPIDVDATDNVWLPFEQRVYQYEGSGSGPHLGHSQNPSEAGTAPSTGLDSISGDATNNEVLTAGGEVFGTGFMNLFNSPSTDPGPLYARWSWGQKVQCAIHLTPAGGKLYFFTWDSTNDFQMRTYNLFSYALEAYIALPTAEVRTPTGIAVNGTESGDVEIHVGAIVSDHSRIIGRYWVYNTSTPAWTWIDNLNNGALVGQPNYGWLLMEAAVVNWGTIQVVAILYNTNLQMYRIVTDFRNCANWAATDANTLTFNGVKNQPNKLMNLHTNENYSPDRVFWVEMGSGDSEGGALLWSWDGTTLRAENKTPADSDTTIPGDVISSDMGVTCMAHTRVNYPDTNTPKGIQFLITCNDFEHGTQHPAGFYGLVQYCNFHAGFLPLMDVSGLSFFNLRSLLAEKMGAVHFYAPDGTFTFKERNGAVGATAFVFSAANGNVQNEPRPKIVSQGWEQIRTEANMLPYGIVIEAVLGDIIKGQSESTGVLDHVSVALDPYERSEWQVVFTSTTAFDVFKLSGSGASSTAKASSDINSNLRDIFDGPYLSFSPDNFSGTFYKSDSFRFWVLPAEVGLQQLDQRDAVFGRRTVAEAAWQRRRAELSSRYLTKEEAPDFVEAYLDWAENPHPIVRLAAVYDPAYLPLAIAEIDDDRLGFTGSDKFKLVLVRHSSDRVTSHLDLQKT